MASPRVRDPCTSPAGPCGRRSPSRPPAPVRERAFLPVRGVFDKSRHGLASSARRLVIEAGYRFWPRDAAGSGTGPGSTGIISTMGRGSPAGPDAVKPGIEGVW